MQDLPESAELLEAVGDLLREQVIDEVADPALRHEVRVAAALCRIIAREMASDVDAEQRRALETLVGAGATVDLEARLADQLLRGRDVDEDVIAALRVVVGAKLDVARPGYRT